VARWLAIAGLAPLLGGCIQASPVGDWTGTLGLAGTDGVDYFNEMSLADDGTGTATLYSVYEQTDKKGNVQDLIAEADFTVQWHHGDDVALLLVCDWDGCVYSPSMDCTFSGYAEMDCDLTPDYYADDTAVLIWTDS
jgi:hypothetical protein